MKAIRVFDGSLNLLTEIDTYESLTFTRDFRKHGMFQIVININLPNTEYLQNDNFILLGNDVDSFGIIKYRKIELDERGDISEKLKIIGYTCDYLFYQRITVGDTTLTNDAETIMRTLIDDNCISATDTDRNFSVLALDTNQNQGATLTVNAKYEQLSDKLERISYSSDLMVYLVYNVSNVLVKFKEAVDRTTTSANPVIFSVEYDNIKSETLTDHLQNVKNYAYIGGSGEGGTRTFTETGSGSDVDRYETFLSYNSNVVADLQNFATQDLDKLNEVFTLSGEILSVKPFEYRTDWDLGDIVTVKNDKWGVRRDALITSVTEIYETNQFNIQVTFGDSETTMNEVLRTKFLNSDNEVRR